MPRLQKQRRDIELAPNCELRIRKHVYRQATLASGIGRIPFVSVDAITSIRTIRVTAVG